MFGAFLLMKFLDKILEKLLHLSVDLGLLVEDTGGFRARREGLWGGGEFGELLF